MRTTNSNTLEKQTLTISNNDQQFVIKAYFIDLDGTTLDGYRKRISKKNIQAIKAKNEFYPVIISTGRAFNNQVKTIIKQLGLSYAICLNGAYVIDNNQQVLANIALENQQVDQVLNIIKKEKIAFTINGIFEVFNDVKWAFFLRWFVFKKFKKISKFNINNYQSIQKITLVGKTRKKMQKVYQILKQEINDVSIKTSGHDYIIEITNQLATKGQGAQLVSKLLNLNVQETIHIGDSENDATTLDYVGALVAMENSSKKLLAVATHRGPSYRHGGLAKVLSGNFEQIKR